MTFEEKYFDTAEWEGFAVREKEVFRSKDVLKPDPLITAGDEGMTDLREQELLPNKPLIISTEK